MKAVLIRITDEFHKKLRQRSVDTGKTVTAIVLEGVELALELPPNTAWHKINDK